MDQAERGVDGEEDHHNWAEEGGDLRCPAALRAEQDDENDDRRRQDIPREAGVDLFQSFERRQNRNCRRDHGVAREQRRPDDSKEKDQRRLLSQRALCERLERQDAALALVVGLHQEQHVFSGDDDQERPNDERDDADHLDRSEFRALELAERGLQRIERAGADVAEHNPDRAEREHPEMPGRMGEDLALTVQGRGRNDVLRKGVGHCETGIPRSPAAAGPSKRRVSILSHPRNGKDYIFVPWINARRQERQECRSSRRRSARHARR